MRLQNRNPPIQQGLYGEKVVDTFSRTVNLYERAFYSHLGTAIVQEGLELNEHLTVDKQMKRLSVAKRTEVVKRFGTGNIILDSIADQFGKPTAAERKKYWRTDQKPVSLIV